VRRQRDILPVHIAAALACTANQRTTVPGLSRYFVLQEIDDHRNQGSGEVIGEYHRARTLPKQSAVGTGHYVPAIAPSLIAVSTHSPALHKRTFRPTSSAFWQAHGTDVSYTLQSVEKANSSKPVLIEMSRLRGALEVKRWLLEGGGRGDSAVRNFSSSTTEEVSMSCSILIASVQWCAKLVRILGRISLTLVPRHPH